jgi:redox-sensitive bicupin YhaK (pirin superfamily)
MTKNVLGIYGNNQEHWVGDGFPVRTLFSYKTLDLHISPFLLLDYAGPHYFEPAAFPRGIVDHPHRGFELVTIVYEGQIQHDDSIGNSDVIGPGDVQWMTAARGIVHKEYHGQRFTQAGGLMRLVQLWINLPAKKKMLPGHHRVLPAAMIPVCDLPLNAGKGRVIAGELFGIKGPAQTFTPMNIWDLRLSRNGDIMLDIPEGFNSMLIVLAGTVNIAGKQTVSEAEMALLSREGQSVRIQALGDATVLALSGQPIEEPIVGDGSFIMNSDAQIREAYEDLKNGQFLRPTC